jgi:HEAT repeat protein
VSPKVASFVDNTASLIRDLGHKDWHVRSSAAKALGQIGNKKAVPALIKTLKDKNEDVREEAATALGEIKDPIAIPALIKAMKDGRYVHSRIAWALFKIGKPAVPALIKALKDKSGYVRGEAAWVLGKLKDKRALPALIKAMKDKNKDVRQKAAEALGKIGDKRASASLVNALRDKAIWVRHEAADALIEIKDKGAIPALTRLFKDKKPANNEVRYLVIRVLGWIEDKRVVPTLVEALGDRRPANQSAAAAGLARINDKEGIFALNKALKRQYYIHINDYLDLPGVIKAIATLGNVAVPGLIGILKRDYSNPQVRWMTASALGRIKDPRALPVLRQVVKTDSSETVREYAQMAIDSISK